MRQLRNITSTSRVAAAVVIVCLSGLSCKLEPGDSNDRPLTLGDIKIALASAAGDNIDIELYGRVADYDVRDSLYDAFGLGLFKHFIEVHDSTGRSVTVFYTLPLAQFLKVDTTTFVTLSYKRIESRSALLIKNKRDSLLCLFGTLLPRELESLEIQGGVQNIRIRSGENPVNTRLTDCGREGDFNMIFGDDFASASVQPAQTAFLFSGSYSYSVTNVANTYLIKNIKACADSIGLFAYAIIKE